MGIHHEIWYLTECYRFWFSFTNCSSWSSGPYSEVISWFLVQFSFSKCLWIPETFVIWTTPGFVSVLLQSKSTKFFHFPLKNDWRLPQNQIRQVTKFISYAHKVASFWKPKHSMEAVFGQTSCISLPLALASLVSLANGEYVDLVIV